MPKFRKKPVVVEAVQFDGRNFGEIQDWAGLGKFLPVDPADHAANSEIIAEVWDKLHSTWVGVKATQWVIKGVKGEFYPCDAEVLAATYDLVSD
jgi:hypothetical protein